MQKHVIVVYDFFEIEPYAKVVKKTKWEKVAFCKENLEYDPKMSYEDNVKDFVEACVESESVYLGDKYIPLHNVHGWHFCNDEKGEKSKKNPKTKPNCQGNNGNNGNKNNQRGPCKKIKHRTGKPRDTRDPKEPKEPRAATTTLPFKVDKTKNPIPTKGIIEGPKIPNSEHEDFLKVRLPDEL